MTEEDLIEELLDREGEGQPPDYLSTHDAGGRTTWGISERAHPQAWALGPPTRQQAAAIYRAQYVAPFLPLQRGGVDVRIRIALIDDAVMSGVEAATKRFQRVLGVAMDGVIGPHTVAAAVTRHPGELLQQYVCERVVRYVRLVQRRPADLVNLAGWVRRVLSFLPAPK